MDLSFWIQLSIVLFCVGYGGRLGGLGLGAAGGLGVFLMVCVLGIPPGSPPIPVLLIIMSVIACTSILQACGGLDLLVRFAERLLRVWPKAITIAGPLVCSIFVIFVGTSYVAFAIYPIIAEVAASAKIRPERALSASVISAGCGVMASPMSAAMAAMVGILASHGIAFWQILAVTIPTFFCALTCAALSVWWRGCELENDPEFRKRVQDGDYQFLASIDTRDKYRPSPKAKTGVLIFLLGIMVSVTLGSIPELRPSVENLSGGTSQLPIPQLIQMVMLSTAFIIIVVCGVKPEKFASGSVFRAGLIGVVAIFGIAWCTGTFFDRHSEVLAKVFSEIASTAPFLFCIGAFCVSSFLFSPTVSTTIMIPLGLKFGLPPEFLIGTWCCCFGDFLIPGGAQIGCTAFDRTGTTKLGTFVVNHSYVRPGLVFVTSGILVGWLISKIVF